MSDYIDKIFEGLRWIFSHLREVAEIALVSMLCALGYKLRSAVAHYETKLSTQKTLSAALSAQLRFANNELEISRRSANGAVTYSKRYVPPEGSVTISQKKVNKKSMDQLGKEYQQAVARNDVISEHRLEKEMNKEINFISINIKDHGFTFNPGFRIDAGSAGISPGLDFKWAYWDRWGLLLGGSKNGVGPGVSRRIDDLFGGYFPNVEVFAQYSLFNFNSVPEPFVAGIRSNF